MKKGLIVPVIVTVMAFFQLLAYIIICIWLPIPIWIKVLGIAILLGFMWIAIAMFAERVKEIESGEEDDLDRY